MKVYWGDISLVKVEYLLFETALKTDLMPIITYCQEQTFLSKAKTTFMNSFIKFRKGVRRLLARCSPPTGFGTQSIPILFFHTKTERQRKHAAWNHRISPEHSFSPS